MTDLTVLTSLQARKLDRAFAHLDVDGDGHLEREDVLALGARLLVGFGEAPTSAKGYDLMASLDDLWDALLEELALGRDGRLGIDDFRDAMAGAFVHGGRYESVLGLVVDAIARLCDTDGDGEVGPGELRTLHEALGHDGGGAEAVLVRLASAGDGRITTAELSEAGREYYTSDDPEAPGNWLFGPVDAPAPSERSGS